MSEILVNCHCGQQLAVPATQGTAEFQCPSCGQLLTISSNQIGQYPAQTTGSAHQTASSQQQTTQYVHPLNNSPDLGEPAPMPVGSSGFPWLTLTICGLSVGLVMAIIAIAAALTPDKNRVAQEQDSNAVGQKSDNEKKKAGEPERNAPADDDGFGNNNKARKENDNRRNPFDGQRNKGGKLNPDELDPRKLLDEKLAEVKKKADEAVKKIEDQKKNPKPDGGRPDNNQQDKDDRDKAKPAEKDKKDHDDKNDELAKDQEEKPIGQILDEMLGDIAGVDLKVEAEVDLNKPVPASKNSLRIGLHLFPPGLRYLAFLDFEKIKDNPKPEDYVYHALNRAYKELKNSIGVEEKDLSFVTLGRIGTHRNYFGFGLFHRPVLMVVRLKSSFDVSGINESEFEKQTISGENIYSPESGFSMAVLNDQTLLIGTRNEVVYALKNKNKKTTDPGYDWVDFSKYEGVFFFNDPRVWGNAIKNDTIYTFIRNRDSLSAKAVVDHAQEFWSALRSDNPRQSRLFQQTDQKTIEMLQKQMDAIDIDAWTEGNVVVQAVKGVKEPYIYHTDSWRTFASVFGSFVQQSGNYGSGKKKLVDETVALSKRFDTYQFQNANERDNLLRALKSNVSRITSYSTTTNFSNDLYNLLASTSSAQVRNACLDGFSDCFDENAMIVLGRESESFELAKTLEPIGFEKRRYGSNSNRSQSRSLRHLTKVRMNALYYVRFGMDPKVVYSAIRILEDIGSEKHISVLETVKEKDYFPEYVAKAADRAISVLSGQRKKTKNIPTAPDAETALNWLDDPMRKNRLAALQWALENPIPGESHEMFMSKLIFLLDDSILREQAISVFRKRGNESDFPALHKIIESATGPNASNFRIRHNYSLEVVVEMMKHFKDSKGLLFAFSRTDDSQTEAWVADMIEEIGADLDEFVRTAIDNYFAQLKADTTGNSNRAWTNRWCSKMVHLTYGDSQKGMLRKWFVEAVEKGHGGHAAIRLMKPCGIFKKKYVPHLIMLWAKDSVGDRALVEYLAKYGPSIEPMVLEQIRKTDHAFNFHVRKAVSLLTKIGTDDTIAYLSEYVDDEHVGEKVQEAIDEIEKANRLPQEFSSVDVD